MIMSNPKGNEDSLTKFKPKWNKGITQPIRVPAAIAIEVLEYARQLDESPAQVDEFDNDNPEAYQDLLAENQALRKQAQESKETVAQVVEVLEAILLANRFTKYHRVRVRNKVVEPLKALVQVN